MKKVFVIFVLILETISMNSCDYEAEAVLCNKRDEPITVYTSSPGFDSNSSLGIDETWKIIKVVPSKGIYQYQLSAKKDATVIQGLNWLDEHNVPFDTLTIITSTDTIKTIGKKNIIDKFVHVPKSKVIFRYVIN